MLEQVAGVGYIAMAVSRLVGLTALEAKHLTWLTRSQRSHVSRTDTGYLPVPDAAQRCSVHVTGGATVVLGVVVAVTALAPGAGAALISLVINEVDYDQPSTDEAEFLELRNVSASAIDLGPTRSSS